MWSWSEKRKASIAAIGIGGLVLFVLVSFLILRDKPTCSNGVRDEGEKGTDCGGVCRLLCEGEALAPLVLFARAVEVDSGLWGAVASLENRNKTAGALRAPYVLKLYDAENILLGERHGETYIPPNKVFAVFDGGMRTGERRPVRAIFEFTAPLSFIRMGEESTIDIRSKDFEVTPDGSLLRVLLYNPNLSPVGHLQLHALLFDEKGNVFAASATNVRGLRSRQSEGASFTWPRELPEPYRIEVLYTIRSE